MKTKFHFLFIFAFLIFLTASGQKTVPTAGGLNSSFFKDFATMQKGNPDPNGISDPGRTLLHPDLDRLLDSVYEYDWDTTAWALKTINHKYRNSNGWLTEDLYVLKNSITGIWNNYVHFLYTYNGSDPDYITAIGEVWTNAASWLPYQYSHYIKKNQVDTTYTKAWDSQKQKFIGGSKVIYAYDTLDSITQKLTQKFDTSSSSWKNNYLTTITYTSPHLISEEVFQNWNASSSTWININRKVDNYDTSNFLIEHIEYVWNDTAVAWQNSSRIKYINDAAGNPLTSLTEAWNTTLLDWETFGQSIFNYNELEWKLFERQQIYNPGTMLFDDYYLIYYTYFTSGILQSTTGNFWKPLTNEWITDNYYLIDSNLKVIDQYVKYHDNVTYEITNGTRTTYTYSAKMQLVNVLKQAWYLPTNDWVNTDQTNYSYNIYKLLDETIEQLWMISESGWVNYTRSTYFYSEPFGINEAGNDKSLCHFANPMKTGSLINCPGFTSGAIYNLKIYSLSGAHVYSSRFVGGNSVSVTTSAPDGLYLMQFTDEQGKVLSTNKVMILK